MPRTPCPRCGYRVRRPRWAHWIAAPDLGPDWIRQCGDAIDQSGMAEMAPDDSRNLVLLP